MLKGKEGLDFLSHKMPPLDKNLRARANSNFSPNIEVNSGCNSYRPHCMKLT